jgi:hypothetical protein
VKYLLSTRLFSLECEEETAIELIPFKEGSIKDSHGEIAAMIIEAGGYSDERIIKRLLCLALHSLRFGRFGFIIAD